jgi:hypothetical protein
MKSKTVERLMKRFNELPIYKRLIIKIKIELICIKRLGIIKYIKGL